MHRCPVCSKSFPSPYKLKRHHVIHTGQKPFGCDICGKAFTQSEHLRTHRQNVHQPRLPTGRLHDGTSTNHQQAHCDEPAAGMSPHGSCDNVIMPSSVSSSVASRPEWKGGSVTRDFCLPLFGTGSMLCADDGTATQGGVSYDTDAVHHDEVGSANVDTSEGNGYTCNVCLKSFSSSIQLWIHLPTHNRSNLRGRGQTFSKKAHAKMHLHSQESRISSRSKATVKHQCPKCLKTFCSPSKLRRHFLIHTGQKPYSCTTCWKSFRQKVHLKSHLGTANTCPHSAVNAGKRKRLSNDSRTSDLQPQRPSSSLTSSVELKLQCKISVNTVHDLRKTEIKLDAVGKPEQPLNTSSGCRKSGEQESQYLTQKDVKPFRCVICNRSFRLEVNLRRHHKIHWNKKELGSPTHEQNSNTVKMSDSETMKRASEPNQADPIDLNIVVKPETWRENDYNDSSPREAALIASAEQQREPCRAASNQKRMNTSHRCHSCSKCFPSRSKLQRHVMTHTGQRPYNCETCGKRFRQKTHLRIHCRTHLWTRYQKQRSLYINRPPSRTGGFNTRTTAEAPIWEMMAHKNDVETHNAEHLDQTPSAVIAQNNVKRESGNKLLPHYSGRNEVLHLRKVSKANVRRAQAAKPMQNPGSEQHGCLQCSKCFPSASKLQRHEMVHTGLKPFQCPTCGKAFRQASHLKRHDRTHCNSEQPKHFNQQVTIKKLRLYPEITVCTPAQRRPISITKVPSLFKTNPKSYTDKKKKLHTCPICCKNFASPFKLSRHLVTHSGMRPYKCTLCSKTFTQRGHLKVHERRCRKGSRISACIRREILNTNHLQDKIENLTDFVVDATREQREQRCPSVGQYSFNDGDLACCTEKIDTDWLEVPEVSLQEERRVENCSQDSNDQATDPYSYSFPSELAFEMDKLVQNQNIAAPPLSHQYEGHARDVKTPCQHDELSSSVDEMADFRDDNKCTSSFVSEHDLKQHLCPARAQAKVTESAPKNRCDVCFKSFVSPSKLERHYLVHTGQRPFRCDICGKTFTQRAHARKHKLTH
ncbi:hypothetical protein F2P81_003306 [Scophthalmus maximus]|uniref:C2H2-type domain-containing protein n=1 Tax=Scophthalmus maximus TaxID=52904 RepID=A0A6A4TI39_SCOMX|nr:hypothetical protein F2P81_003306 [Scophthalmus maximus]